MSYKRSRFAHSWLRSFLYFVFSRCGRSIVRHILPVFLCCLVVALPATVPSFAASDTIYTIRDFDVQAFQVGNVNDQPGQDYSSSVAFEDVNYSNYDLTAIYNTNSAFYTSGYAKNEVCIALTNLSLEDEYNLQFFYSIMSETSYTIIVGLLNSSDESLATLYTAEYNYQSGGRMGVHECNVNFTLKNLGVSSNQGIKLMIWLVVPSGFGYSFHFGFSDIVFTNLDDDSGLFDSILNWLSRIYHSIAGGTDREGVNHEGIVQGIKNGLNSLGTRIGNFFADLKQGFLDKLEAVKTSITNAISSIQQWFIDLKDNLINGLKSLFIPSDGYFASKKTQLENFATEHFGALYQGPDVMIDLIRKLLTVNPSANPGITMPAIEFDFLGQHYNLSESIHYSFSWVNDSSHPLYYFYHIYRGFVTVILFVGFGNYLVKKYRDVFEGGGDGE